MKRVIFSISVVVGIVLAASCQQHTCPTYIKAPKDAKQECKRS